MKSLNSRALDRACNSWDIYIYNVIMLYICYIMFYIYIYKIHHFILSLCLSISCRGNQGNRNFIMNHLIFNRIPGCVVEWWFVSGKLFQERILSLPLDSASLLFWLFCRIDTSIPHLAQRFSIMPFKSQKGRRLRWCKLWCYSLCHCPREREGYTG